MPLTFSSHIYYLPFYFQAVKGTTAEGSGIRTIPYLVSVTLASIVIGGLITVTGRYLYFTWAGSAIFTVGAALLYTLPVNAPAGHWIGYQILAGIGAGGSIQIPFIAIQVVLSEKDMASGSKPNPTNPFPSSHPNQPPPSSRRPRHLLQFPRRRHRHLHCPKHLLQYPHQKDPPLHHRRRPRHYHRRRRHSRPRRLPARPASWRSSGLRRGGHECVHSPHCRRRHCVFVFPVLGE